MKINKCGNCGYFYSDKDELIPYCHYEYSSECEDEDEDDDELYEEIF